MKTETFNERTLRLAKKEKVGQDVVFFRLMRKQVSKANNKCRCGKKISLFEITCVNCVTKAWKEEEEDKKRNQQWVDYYNGKGNMPDS